MYENVCGECNKGAWESRELKIVSLDVPSIYVGETSRSLQERTVEHWSDYRTGSNKSHMLKHQAMEHGGAPPQFVMRVVSTHKTALSRQIAEAVRIRRRGGAGAILNSRAEYNRCHIPRLQMEEEEQEGSKEQEDQKLIQKAENDIAESIAQWESHRVLEKAREHKSNLGRMIGAKKKFD